MTKPQRRVVYLDESTGEKSGEQSITQNSNKLGLRVSPNRSTLAKREILQKDLVSLNRPLSDRQPATTKDRSQYVTLDPLTILLFYF